MRYKNAIITTKNCSTKLNGGYFLDVNTQKYGMLKLKVLQTNACMETNETLHMVFDTFNNNLLFLVALQCDRNGWDFAENTCECSLGTKEFIVMFNDYYEGAYKEIAQYILEIENAVYYTADDTQKAIYDEVSKNWN